MDILQKYNQELEDEIKQFLFLCGKNDTQILLAQDKSKKTNEYVRLSCIAMAFGYKKMLLKIIASDEKYFDVFMKKLDEVSTNFILINEWILEFINNIEYPKAKQLAYDCWQELKSQLDINNFNIRQLLK